jgi:hypothetical protein
LITSRRRQYEKAILSIYSLIDRRASLCMLAYAVGGSFFSKKKWDATRIDKGGVPIAETV